MRRGVGLAIALCLLAACRPAPEWGNGGIGVDLSAADKESCREISFPKGWQFPDEDDNGLGYPHPFTEYEFRQGDTAAEFLVAGAFEKQFVPRYTTNKYRMNLASGQANAMPIDDAAWERAAAKVVPLYRKSIFSNYPQLVASGGVAEFQGKRFAKTGEFWADQQEYATRLSPDQTWLVLQSRTRPGEGKVFFDVFSVATGTKLLALEGPLHAVWPDGLIGESGWLTERYFVIPTGGYFQRSVICDFDRAGAGAKR